MRYCPKCSTEVEDTGGYCLLGHRLALDPPISSISQLREEIDRSFEDANLEVTAVLATVGGETREEAIAYGDIPTGPMRTAAPAAPARMAPPPPPPPPAISKKPNPWEELENEIDISGDPIAAFAPAPRMDWGPEKAKLFRRRVPKTPSSEDA